MTEKQYLESTRDVMLAAIQVYRYQQKPDAAALAVMIKELDGLDYKTFTHLANAVNMTAPEAYRVMGGALDANGEEGLKVANKMWQNNVNELWNNIPKKRDESTDYVDAPSLKSVRDFMVLSLKPNKSGMELWESQRSTEYIKNTPHVRDGIESYLMDYLNSGQASPEEIRWTNEWLNLIKD